jgi:hypothetical protein
MKRRFWRGLTAATLFAVLPAAAVVVSQSNRAASADEETGGRVVQISPEEDNKPIKAEEEEEVQEAEAPKYWLGAQVMPVLDPALRTHLQLADDVGLLVGQVVPEGPAAKAGLREYDIVIAVNGETLNDREQLLSFLDKNGDKAFELKIIRLAKEMKVKVSPEERPADAQRALPQDGQQNPLQELERLFGQGVPGLRRFGNGVVLNGPGFDINQAPNGVSVSITRDGDQPAKVTVKKGDKTWTIQGDDEKALKELPDDVRPFVEQLLHGSRGGRIGMNFDFGRDWQQFIPNELGQLGEGLDNGALRQRAQQMRQRTDQATRRMQRQLEEMQKQLERLQQQFEENSPNNRTNPADDPSKT